MKAIALTRYLPITDPESLFDAELPINAANLRAAHAKIESGKTIGKIVLAGW